MTTSSSSSSSMSTTTLLQHPRHDQQHSLEPRDFSKDSIPPRCHLCFWKISAEGYACQECKFIVHRVCAEAPPRIYHHPLHTEHLLTLIHCPPPFHCEACDKHFPPVVTSFRCDDCDFNLDIRCALCTQSDRGGIQGKTPEQINLPFHPHKLTSFSTRHDFIGDSNCVICKESVEGDGYTCLHWLCEFIIHKRCIPDLYYTDRTKAPQVYHRHPLETFLGEDMGTRRCAKCGSQAWSGEFIGCAECQVFFCRGCVQVSESIQYPHHLAHNLVLFINSLNNDKPQCDSCLVSLKGEFCYGCPSCEFFVDVGCALQVLAYCEEGMNSVIKLPWHEHPLLLCHRTKYDWQHCSCCEEESSGTMYACKEEGCKILLHKRCTEIESTIINRHHPDHPLTLCNKGDLQICGACSEYIYYLKFFCQLCSFNLHAKCAAHVSTRKHYLHEHELLHLKSDLFCECNRCGTSTSSPFFRCVPCNFNLHEECMELPPQVVNSKVHWHPLTLHETYIEDDSGEYYCDQCEKWRDERMGVYVCLYCSARWAFHIECVFPELRKVCAKDNTIAIQKLTYEISRGEEEVRDVERKLDEMKRELEEKRKKRASLIM